MSTTHRNPSTAVSFDETSRVYTGGYDGWVIAWERDARTVRWSRRHDGLVNDVAVGPRLVASVGADRRVRMWDRETGEAIAITFPRCDEDLNAAVLSEDEARVAAVGDDGILRVFGVASGRLLWQRFCAPPERYGESIEALSAIDLDGERLLAAVDNSGHVVVLDFSGESRCTRSIAQELGDNDVECCSADPKTAQIVCGTSDGRVLFVPLDEALPVTSIHPHISAIKAVACIGDALVTTAYDSALVVSNMDGEPAQDPHPLVGGGRYGWARGLAVDPVNPTRLACSSVAGAPQIWNVDAGTLEVPDPAPTVGINGCVASHGRIFAGTDGGEVFLAVPGKDAEPFARVTGMVLWLAAHPDDFVLCATTHYGSVVLLEMGTGQLVNAVESPGDPVVCAGFSGDGLLAVGSYSGKVRLFTCPDLKELRSWRATDTVKSLTFGPDGLLVMAAAHGTLSLWESGTGDELARRQGLFLLNDIDWNPGTGLITTVGRDRIIRQWTRDLELRRSLPAHKRSIKTVATSPDGRSLATSGYDAVIEVRHDDSSIIRLEGHDLPGVPTLTWLDSDLLVSGGWDGTVRLWSVSRGTSTVMRIPYGRA